MSVNKGLSLKMGREVVAWRAVEDDVGVSSAESEPFSGGGGNP